jgi:peptidoglycan/xylan/chitin deacetylase (PgdA/CDA1 family)
LDALDRLTVAASFFLQGRWAEAHPDRAQRIAMGGHLVGNHGHYHVRMPLLSAAGIRADIAQAESAIIDATGVDPKPWFRCAFGAGGQDARIQGLLLKAGYRHVGWDVEVEDWSPERTGRLIADAVVARVRDHRAAGGDEPRIVLLHTWPAGTAAGIEGIVTGLRNAGAELVRLDELQPA